MWMAAVGPVQESDKTRAEDLAPGAKLKSIRISSVSRGVQGT